MRFDMSKVIVERPRLRWPLKNGSAYPRGHLENQWAPRLEDAPLIESMGGVYGTKWLNENLQPLVRFLHSNVGRPWDKVHAEIAERISSKNAVQKHVLDHLRDYVREDVVFDGKAVMVLSGYHRFRPLESHGMRLRFYVDPRTRLLRLAPRVARKSSKRAVDPNRRVVSHREELHRLDGIWYAITVAPIPSNLEARMRCFDVLSRVHLRGAAFEAETWKNDLWKTGRYAASKVQLGKRQIARHGLSPS